MDKMQFLECSGNSTASAGNLGQIRYTYGFAGTGLDPSGSSFQGKIVNEYGNPMWLKFGTGQTTHIQYWTERLAPGGAGCIVSTRSAPQGWGTALEIYPADCCGNHSFAIGKDCSAAYASVAAGTGNKALGSNSVAMGKDCSAWDDYNVALGNGADASGTCGFMYKDASENVF